MVRGIKPPGKQAKAHGAHGTASASKPTVENVDVDAFYDSYKKRHGDMLAAMGKAD